MRRESASGALESTQRQLLRLPGRPLALVSFGRKWLLGLILLGAVSAAQGQTIINGSFEAGGGSLSSWTVVGNASVSGTTLTAPVSGSWQALLVAPSGAGASAASLSAFFGGVALPSTARGAATIGSGIKQTFTLTSAATLSFSYKYVTGEAVSSGYDSSFVFKDGTLTSLASSTSAGLSSSRGVSGYSNGLNYVTATISLAAGTHTIGFGVYNTADTAVASAIFVDNVFSTSAVPEPATTALWFAVGAAGCVWWRRRVKRRI